MRGARHLKTLGGLEDRIYLRQRQIIMRRFGKEAAESANYGWGVSSGSDWVTIETKIYGHGVITSAGIIGEGIRHHIY